MSRKETTKRLSQLLVDTMIVFRTYWATEVTFDYGTSHPIRVDFMKFEPKNQSVGGIEHGIFTCFEVKSCKADFMSKNGHNFIGDKNYYVMTEETYQEVQGLIPWNVGVYAEEDGELKCVKRATIGMRERSGMEMLFMMFRSGLDYKYICKNCTHEYEREKS